MVKTIEDDTVPSNSNKKKNLSSEAQDRLAFGFENGRTKVPVARSTPSVGTTDAPGGRHQSPRRPLFPR